jgi:hypothetical protein
MAYSPIGEVSHFEVPMHLNMPDSVVPAQLAHPLTAEGSTPSNDRESEMSPAARMTSALAENRELNGQVEQLRAERTRWMETQRRMMDLLHTAAPEKLIHDLRNLLNERDLLKTLVDQM